MGSEKYVGLDVHKDTISIAVMNSAGKLIMDPSSKQRRSRFYSFSKGCTATCMSPWRKEPGPPGCTTC